MCLEVVTCADYSTATAEDIFQIQVKCFAMTSGKYVFECGTALFIFRHSFVLSSNPTLLACHVAVY